MTGILLDTHVWFWYLTGSRRLSRTLRRALERSSVWWLSPISVWELGLLAAAGRIRLREDYRGWVDTAFDHLPLREAALTHEIARRALDIGLAHRDPADRFLAATALTYELTLATADERLRSTTWLPTLPA